MSYHRAILFIPAFAALALSAHSGCTTLQPYQPARTAAPSDALQECLSHPDSRCLRSQAFVVAQPLANPVVRDELMQRIAANQLLHGEFDAGLRSVRRIHDLSLRYGLLEQIHEEFLRSSPARAQRLRDEAMQLNRTHLPYNRAIGDFYITLMRLGEAWHQDTPTPAQNMVPIDDYLRRYARNQDRVLAQFAVVVFDKGQAPTAHALVRRIDDLHWKGFAYANFMKSGDQSPQLQTALESLVTQALASRALSTLQQMATGMAYRGEFEQALHLAGQIDNAYLRLQSLCDIAAVAASRSQTALAETLWQRARAMAETAEHHRPRDRGASYPPTGVLIAEAMQQLTIEYAKQGQGHKALELAGAIAPLSPAVSDAALARLSEEMALQAQFDAARQVASQIIAERTRALALANLAIRRHASGHTNEAFHLIFSLEYRPAVDHALGEIALQLAKAGHWQHALALLGRIQLAFKYADTLNRLSILRARDEQTAGTLALARPLHMRIIRTSTRTRP